MPILRFIFSTLLGLMFGYGLIVSGMTDTTKVIGFLDITGAWQPALAVVMGVAVLTALPFFFFGKKRHKPMIGEAFVEPPFKVDTKLIAGAALFGIGWGLVGLCPGPALVWAGLNIKAMAPFLAAFVVGAFMADRIASKV